MAPRMFHRHGWFMFPSPIHLNQLVGTHGVWVPQKKNIHKLYQFNWVWLPILLGEISDFCNRPISCRSGPNFCKIPALLESGGEKKTISCCLNRSPSNLPAWCYFSSDGFLAFWSTYFPSPKKNIFTTSHSYPFRRDNFPLDDSPSKNNLHLFRIWLPSIPRKASWAAPASSPQPIGFRSRPRSLASPPWANHPFHMRIIVCTCCVSLPILDTLQKTKFFAG